MPTRRPLAAIAFALLTVALGGCRSDPLAAVGPPEHVLQVAWHEERGQAHVDAAGVCHYYARDTERGLNVVWGQVQECLQGTAPVREARDPGRGVRKVRLYFVPSYVDLNRRYIELYGMASFKALDAVASRDNGGLFCQRMGGCSYILGFYFDDGVTLVRGERRSQESLGHELKHVYEGHFHDGRGRWY